MAVHNWCARLCVCVCLWPVRLSFIKNWLGCAPGQVDWAPSPLGCPQWAPLFPAGGEPRAPSVTRAPSPKTVSNAHHCWSALDATRAAAIGGGGRKVCIFCSPSLLSPCGASEELHWRSLGPAHLARNLIQAARWGPPDRPRWAQQAGRALASRLHSSTPARENCKAKNMTRPAKRAHTQSLSLSLCLGLALALKRAASPKQNRPQLTRQMAYKTAASFSRPLRASLERSLGALEWSPGRAVCILLREKWAQNLAGFCRQCKAHYWPHPDGGRKFFSKPPARPSWNQFFSTSPPSFALPQLGQPAARRLLLASSSLLWKASCVSVSLGDQLE